MRGVVGLFWPNSDKQAKCQSPNSGDLFEFKFTAQV